MALPSNSLKNGLYVIYIFKIWVRFIKFGLLVSVSPLWGSFHSPFALALKNHGNFPKSQSGDSAELSYKIAPLASSQHLSVEEITPSKVRFS